MFATDFIFDDAYLSDFGLIIGYLDTESNSISGGEINLNVIQTPNRDRYTYFGRDFSSVLQWNFSIIKNPCNYTGGNQMYFTQYEESEIARWLLKKDGYHWMRFEQNGYKDIWYNVMFDMTPHQINGKTIGFNLVVKSDCGYGFSSEVERNNLINSSTPFYLNINSDIDTYIYPYIKITNGTGDFYIYNESDKMQTLSNNNQSNFYKISNTILMDSDNDIINGIDSPQNFNWRFLRLLQGINVLKTNSETNLQISIKYREPRRVLV